MLVDWTYGRSEGWSRRMSIVEGWWVMGFLVVRGQGVFKAGDNGYAEWVVAMDIEKGIGGRRLLFGSVIGPATVRPCSPASSVEVWPF